MEDNIFRALFEHSSMGIIISDIDGVIVKVNAFACKMFDYEKEDLVGEKVDVLLPVNLRKKHIKQRESYNKNPTPRTMGSSINLKAIKKDSSEFPVEVSLSFYEIKDQRYIVSFINEITERKKREAELKDLTIKLESKIEERTRELSQALIEVNHINDNLEKEIVQRKLLEAQAVSALEKERELNEMKSRFVSMASHEFRTPLSGILTSIALINRYADEEQKPKRQKHIHIIKKLVKNLTAILNDFLSLDKLNQGALGANPSRFMLCEMTAETIDEIQDILYEQQNITLQGPDQDIEVFQDPDMLRNVLINLLSNAIKYSPNGKPIHVTVELKQSNVKMTIQDQGMGIPENEQKHIFMRFFRAHNVSTIPGTGLGLNIVRRYLELMGGTIEFVSAENKGTTFIMNFPTEILG